MNQENLSKLIECNNSIINQELTKKYVNNTSDEECLVSMILQMHRKLQKNKIAEK